MTWTAILWLGDVGDPDHMADAQADLVAHLADKTRMAALLAALVRNLNSLEDATLEVLTGRSIYTAVGDQLDVLGRIVGQLRGTMTDQEYRIALLGRIFVNRGDGTLPQFAALLDLLDVPYFTIYEFYPAALEANATGVLHPTVVGDLLFDLKGGGIGLHWVWSTYGEDEVFTLSDTPASDQLDADRGLSDLAGLTGGRFPDMRWTR